MIAGILTPELAAAGVLKKVRSKAKRSQSSQSSSQGQRNARNDPGPAVVGARRVRPGYVAGYGAAGGLWLYGPYGYGWARRPPPPAVSGTQRAEPAEPRRPFRLQAGLSRGRNSGPDGVIDRYRLDARLQTPTLLDVSFSGMMMEEEVAPGTVDQLALWKATGWIRVLEHEKGEAAVGVGARRLFDRVDGVNGGHLALSVRAFPLEPFIVDGRLDVGRVGDAVNLDWSTSVGVLLGPVELYGAWTGITFDDVWLSGPSVGVRLWI